MRKQSLLGYKATSYFSTRNKALEEARKLRAKGIRARVEREMFNRKWWVVWTRVS